MQLLHTSIYLLNTSHPMQPLIATLSVMYYDYYSACTCTCTCLTFPYSLHMSYTISVIHTQYILHPNPFISHAHNAGRLRDCSTQQGKNHTLHHYHHSEFACGVVSTPPKAYNNQCTCTVHHRLGGTW